MRPQKTSSRLARATAVIVAGASIGLATSACTSSSTPSPTSSDAASASASAAQVAKLLQQGVDQATQQKTDDAVATFNSVLAIDPNNKYALYNLGLIAQNRNDTANATSYYDRAIKSDPSYTPAMYNKAIILEASNLDGAVALYEKIVQINPNASTAWYRLSLAYERQGQADKATDAKAKALALDPSLAGSTPAPATPTPSRKP